MITCREDFPRRPQEMVSCASARHPQTAYSILGTYQTLAPVLSTRAYRYCHWTSMLGGNSHPYPSMHCFCLFLVGCLQSEPACPQPAQGFSLLNIEYILSIGKITVIMCKFLDWPVKAIVTAHMHSLLEQTESTA